MERGVLHIGGILVIVAPLPTRKTLSVSHLYGNDQPTDAVKPGDKIILSI